MIRKVVEDVLTFADRRLALETLGTGNLYLSIYLGINVPRFVKGGAYVEYKRSRHPTENLIMIISGR